MYRGNDRVACRKEFEIIDKLGKGSYGAVYKLKYQGEIYAAKTTEFKKGLNHVYATIYDGLITGYASQNNPYVPRVYQIFHCQEDRTLVVLMDLVEGVDLNEYIHLLAEYPDDDRKFRTKMAITEGLLKGLDKIHQQGIIHRDFKPANVMISKERPYIIDFGLSCFSGSQVEDYIRANVPKEFQAPIITDFKCRPIPLAGTGTFAPPESFKIVKKGRPRRDIYNVNVSRKMDDYGLGLTLYCLWTDQTRPFSSKSKDETIEILKRSLQNSDLPLPGLESVPPKISQIIRGLSSIDYTQRMTTHQALQIFNSISRDSEMEILPPPFPLDNIELPPPSGEWSVTYEVIEVRVKISQGVKNELIKNLTRRGAQISYEDEELTEILFPYRDELIYLTISSEQGDIILKTPDSDLILRKIDEYLDNEE